MSEHITYLLVSWSAAILFLGIGFYIRKRKTPMWLEIGKKVTSDQIKDVPAYNRAIGKMWCLFSIPLWIFGLVLLVYPAASVPLFGVFCLAAIGGGVWWQHKIEQQYMR